MLGTLLQASSAMGGRLAVQCRPGASRLGWPAASRAQQQTLRAGTRGSPAGHLLSHRLSCDRTPAVSGLEGQASPPGEERGIWKVETITTPAPVLGDFINALCPVALFPTPPHPPSYLRCLDPGSVLLLQLHLRLCPDALSTGQAGRVEASRKLLGRAAGAARWWLRLEGQDQGASSSPLNPFWLLVPAGVEQKALPVALSGRREPGRHEPGEGDVTQEPQVAGWREGVCGRGVPRGELESSQSQIRIRGVSVFLVCLSLWFLFCFVFLRKAGWRGGALAESTERDVVPGDV